MHNDIAELVRLVLDQPGIASVALADAFGVSTRTIRARIKQANALLDGAARIAFRRAHGSEGYHLEVVDKELFERALSRMGARQGAAPQDSGERIGYLLDDLLSRNEWVTLDVLADILYVSRASISADLKKVEAVLADEGLALERRPRYGIRVVGPELARRRCLARSAARLSGTGGSVGTPLEQRLMLDAVSSCVERALSEESFSVNSASYRNVIVHAAIALLRAQGGGSPQFDEDALLRIERSSAHGVARRIAAAIKEELSIDLPASEVAYLAIHLAGHQVISEEGAGALSETSGLVISADVWRVVEKMLDAVWDMYRFELRDDLELRMNLARHVAPLSVRLRYNIAMRNPLLNEIKSAYPFAYSMAAEASTVLADTFGVVPSDDEIGYIALSFALALERKGSARPKKNVLVVCGAGMASAKLLAVKLDQSFGPYLGRVETCEVSELRTRDLTDIDYVFTTVPVPFELRVPQLMVGQFLDDEDRSVVERALRSGGAHQGEPSCDRRLFFPHVDAADKLELIHRLCERVAEVERVDADFEQLVMERERMFPTSFGNRVALPHPMRPASERTFVCVALLDDPILWNGHEVQAVFLLSISRDPQQDAQAFYRPLTRLWLSEDSISRLLEERTYESLMRELEGGEKGE